MATSVTKAQQDQIAQLYVSLFNRAPDAGGFAGWVESLAKGTSLNVIAQDFYLSPEGQATYSRALTNQQFVEAFYTKFLGRNLTTEDKGGITYWVGRLGETGATHGAIAAEIIKNIVNYTGTDPVVLASKAIIDSKVAVGEHYALVLNGNVAGAAAAVDGVTNATTAAAKIADLGTSGTIGSTFTLTTGADNVVGTAGNDTLNSVVILQNNAAGAIDTTQSTLGTADTITGGAGTDLLNVLVAGGGETVANAVVSVALPPSTVSGVEKLFVRNLAVKEDAGAVAGVTETLAVAVDASLFGASQVWADRSTSALIVSNLANNGVLGMVGNASVTNGAISGAFVATATAGVLAVDGGTKAGAVTITGPALKTLTVQSTGVANTIGAVVNAASVETINIQATTALTTGAWTSAGAKTLNVSGAGAVNLSATAAPATLEKIDASGSTGGVTITSGATTTAFVGGAGNDKLTIGTLVYNGAAKIDGGAGTDILAIADATATLFTTASKANITGFEVLEVSSGATLAIDFAALTGLTALNLAAANSLVISNVGAATPVTIVGNQTAALTINVKDATNPLNTADSLTLTLDATGAATATSVVTVANLASVGLETLNIVSQGVLGNDSAVTTDNNVITTLDGLSTSNINKIVVSGGSDLSLATGNIARTVNIDGSAATGNLIVDASANTSATAISGGTGKDVLTGGAGTDVLNGGAGDDSLTGGAGADTLTGGVGKNTFVFANTSTGTPTSTNFDTITDFRAGSGNVIDFGGITLVATAGGSGASGQAAIAATGIATFNVADSTLALQLAAVEAAMVATGGAAAGETAIWQNGSDAYLFVSDATGGLSATDVLVKLTGVTVGATGLTILAGDIVTIA